MKSGLVIDDNAMNRFTYVAMLDTIGIEPSEAENATDAISLCKENMPDLILLDWVMPKINGLDFLKLISQVKGGHKPYIIMCSGEQIKQSDIDKSIEMGANYYVTKPLRVEKLREIISDFTKKRNKK